MDDYISRQAAIAVADSSDYVGLSVDDVKKVTDEVVKGLKRLPSVQPEPRWIPCGDSILIKGVKMPKGCVYEGENGKTEYCFLCNHADVPFCMYLEWEPEAAIGIDERPCYCPLKEQEPCEVNKMMLDGYATENYLKRLEEKQSTEGSFLWSDTPNHPKMTGWICPVCGRGLSPYTSFCPCKGFVQGEWKITC